MLRGRLNVNKDYIMTEKLKLYKLVARLLFILMFLGLAIWEFTEGNQTDGILWLILCQVYDNKATKEG